MTTTIAVAGRCGASKTNPAGLLIRRRHPGPAPPHDDRADAVQHLRAHEKRATGMALTVLQIHKLLPKTNRTECGLPACPAFAMKFTQKGAELDTCPYVSDEAKRVGLAFTLSGIAVP